MNSYQSPITSYQLTKRGFTLIEILVVLAIIGFFIGMMARTFIQHNNQRCFDETLEKMQQLKEALLGNPASYINGQRQFSGYIPDMGGLPELIDGQPKGLWTDDLDNDGIGDLPLWEYKHSLKTWCGWRGPYIEYPFLKKGELQGEEKIRDAWGNPFIFSVADNKMTIESYGADGIDDTVEKDGFDKDIEMTISSTEYTAPLGGQVSGFDNRINVRIRIYFATEGKEAKKTIRGVSEKGYFRFEFVEGESDGIGRANISMPIGMHRIVIWEEDSPSGDPELDSPNDPRKEFIFYLKPSSFWLGEIRLS